MKYSYNDVVALLENAKNMDFIKNLRREKNVKERRSEIVKIVLIVVGIIAVLVAAGVFLYNFLTPDSVEDPEEEDFDDFDDELFEDDDEEEISGI